MLPVWRHRFNRTILELKHNLRFQTKSLGTRFNRTILELKHDRDNAREA